MGVPEQSSKSLDPLNIETQGFGIFLMICLYDFFKI